MWKLHYKMLELAQRSPPSLQGSSGWGCVWVTLQAVHLRGACLPTELWICRAAHLQSHSLLNIKEVARITQMQSLIFAWTWFPKIPGIWSSNMCSLHCRFSTHFKGRILVHSKHSLRKGLWHSRVNCMILDEGNLASNIQKFIFGLNFTPVALLLPSGRFGPE